MATAQGSLFDEGWQPTLAPHAYLPREPTDTQVAAARRALPKSGTQRRRVYDLLAAAGEGGLTDEEISRRLGLSLNSVRPRRLELVEAGLIEDSTRRRDTQGNNPAIVWTAVQEEQ